MSMYVPMYDFLPRSKHIYFICLPECLKSKFKTQNVRDAKILQNNVLKYLVRCIFGAAPTMQWEMDKRIV